MASAASRGRRHLARLLTPRRAPPSLVDPRIVVALPAGAFSPPRRRRAYRPLAGDTTPVLATGNVSLENPAFCVWGANTAVGKTLVSAGLAAAARRRAVPFLYLKPVQTGFPDDSDADFVATRAGHGPVATMGPHAAVAAHGSVDAGSARHGSSAALDRPLDAPGSSSYPFWAHTSFAWRRATGPQAAVAEEGRAASDDEILAAVTAHLAQFADHCVGPAAAAFTSGGGAGVAVVETAGGVCSPAPSGTLQCDAYRPMRLPAVLVGDGALGGISVTIAAMDALAMRGYDLVAVVIADEGHGNAEAVREYAEKHRAAGGGGGYASGEYSGDDRLARPEVFALDRVPDRPSVLGGAFGASSAERAAGGEIYEWLDDNARAFDAALARMTRWHDRRVEALKSAPDRAMRHLWWPFTQHDLVARSDVAVIDSRHGEDFGVYVSDAAGVGGDSAWGLGEFGGGPGAVQLRFDGAASWWTQGVSGALHARLVRAAASAGGRYGHVMFPENAHEPALDAAAALLRGAGRGWGARVFYSDNGSTAMEVAVKMAIRTYYARKGLVRPGRGRDEAAGALPQVRVLALDGSYHGDTLGTMDMQAPSVFTGPMQTPWYQPRGLFLNPPVLQMRRGRWEVRANGAGLCNDPALCGACGCDDEREKKAGGSGEEEDASGGASSPSASFATRAEAFDVRRRVTTPLASEYRAAIERVLDRADLASARGEAPPVAALVMECVLHGAGGMNLIDPLFQKVLIRACRDRGLPVVLDEVFAGIWRLGAEGAWELLGETPDVSCYAKLFTGGLVPLAATVATEEVFDAFRGPTKADGLLHGHSYTAYPIGCAVAAEAMRMYKDPEANPNLIVVGEESGAASAAAAAERGAGTGGGGGGGGGAGVEDGSAASSASSSSLRLRVESGDLKLRLRDLWDEEALQRLSHLPNVAGVTAIGCVLAVEVDDGEGGGGYSSGAAKAITSRLRARSIQARPLGNVLYLMCAPTTPPERCAELMDAVHRELQEAALGDDEDW